MTAADQIKTCCAAAYSNDLVTVLLGESYHPGGLALTRRLADRLTLTPGSRVLDLAAGRGATALVLARAYDVDVDGVDLAAANVTLARGAADAADLTDRVRFHVADAERLPFDDATFDAVVCECAFCTFPDKRAAAAELGRVLRPGGRVGISDVTVDRDRLPATLSSLAAWVACIGDARRLEGYAAMLTGAGLHVTYSERHDDAVARMIEQIAARLSLLRVTARGRAVGLSMDFGRADDVLADARAAVADGVIGYALLVAQRPI